MGHGRHREGKVRGRLRGGALGLGAAAAIAIVAVLAVAVVVNIPALARSGGSGTPTIAKALRIANEASETAEDALDVAIANKKARGPKGEPGSAGDAGPKGEPGPQGPKGEAGPSVGAAVADVQIHQQPAPPTPSISCTTTYDTFCGNPAGGVYWNQPAGGELSYLGYYVEPSGFIHFQGAAQRVGGFTGGIGELVTGSLMFVLPPGRRPSATLSFPVIQQTPSSYDVDAIVRIKVNGEVRLVRKASDGTVFELSGIRFRTAG